MPDLAHLAVKITPQGILITNDQLEKLAHTSEKTEKKTKSMMDKFKDMQAVMQGPVAAARAVVGGLQQVIAVGADLVASYKVQEQAVSNLNAVLAATGGTVGFTSQELQDMASSLQSVTTFGDEAIIGMNAVLLGFRSITGDQFKRTTEAILDMSQVMGQDLVSSANMVGKALDSPTQGMAALSRVGFVWTDQQREMVKAMEESGDLMGAQNVILDELEKAFGGAARAAGDTATGAIDQLNNALGDLKESVGGILAETSGGWLADLIKGGAEGISGTINDTLELGRAIKAVREGTDTDAQAILVLENNAKLQRERVEAAWEWVEATKSGSNAQKEALAIYEREVAALKAIRDQQQGIRESANASSAQGATPAGPSAADTTAATHIKEVTAAMNERLRVAQLEANIRGEQFTQQEQLNILYQAYAELVDPAKFVSEQNSAAQALRQRIEVVKTLTDEELAAEEARKKAEEEAEDRAVAMARAVVDLTEKYKTHKERIAENIQRVNELWQGGYISLDLYQEALAALSREMEEAGKVVDETLEKTNQAVGDLTTELGRIAKTAAIDTFEAIGAALAAGENGAQTFEQAMLDIGISILQQLPLLMLNAGLQLVAVNPPAGLALIAASGLVAIGAGAVTYAQSQSGSVTANALGGVYGSPSLSAYSNGVYDSPQMFAFANGAGVFAEAGAEAIMPLERDASGRLGVSASGASVSVIINNMAQGAQVTQEERTGPDGSRQVIATIKSIVKSMGRDGELDGVMGRYGLAPRGIRR